MLNSIIEKIINAAPTEVDLTNPEHSDLMMSSVETLLKHNITLADINQFENELLSGNKMDLIFILLALKLAKAKLIVKDIKTPLEVTVLFAVYKEHNRIKKNNEHPHGEDFLRRKVNQLSWLFDQSPNVSWKLVVVDDGCPEHSGKIAEQIIKKDGLAANVEVLYLQNAIDQHLAPVKSMTATSDSQKGGSITFGMWSAIQHKSDRPHVVIYTDADLSTHLGQVGLLLNPIVNKNKSVAIGSRRELDSVVIKQGTRNDRGKLFIYLWKRLIPNLGNIIDTQCGFKAFNANIVDYLVRDMIEKKFAFDIELLIKTALKKENDIEKVGIAWIDSEAASTTTDIQPYLPMLKSMVLMYQKYFNPNDQSDEFAAFINDLDDEKFDSMLSNIPKEITDKEPMEFTDFDGVKVEHLKRI